jgi:nucleoprotein TPR
MELYKEQYAKSREELDEAATAIFEFQKITADLKSEYSKLADEKKMNETAYEAKFKENSEAIGKLEQELKNANELLSIAKRKGANVLSESDITQMSPAAAVASRLLKNGMTLTQVND